MSDVLFPSAVDLRTNARAYLIIHDEIRAIEEAVLMAADSGQLDAIVFNTYMSNTVLGTFAPIVNVNITTDVVNQVAHGYQTGDQIEFTSSMTLPVPLVLGTTYYAILVNVDNFKVAASYSDCISNIAIDLTTFSTGTIQSRLIVWSQRYFKTWQGNKVERPLIDHMNGVINYFQGLGYSIVRQVNPTTSQTFRWAISW